MTTNSRTETKQADPDDWLAATRASLLENSLLSDSEGKRNCVDYHDKPSEMTGGRLLARFLSRFSIYYPQRHTSTVDLDRAWAHYEHVTLGRMYRDEYDKHSRQHHPDNKHKHGTVFVRAPPGERKRPTQLYPLIRTPTDALKAFGVSVRIYFSTLLVLAAFLGMAALLNAPLGWFFRQPSYSENARAMNELTWAVQASAVCADTLWVECDDTCQDHLSDFYQRVNAQDGTFLKNTCDFDDWLWPGIFSYAASILLILQFGVAFLWLQRRAEIVFDEEIQTASDYSIKVCNPPSKALCPDEWKNYFSVFGKVTLCTVAVDNAKLLQKLVQRRRTIKRLQQGLPENTNMDNSNDLQQAVKARTPSSFWGSIPGLAPSLQSLYDTVVKLDAEICDLVTTSTNKSVAIYITFETERGQRNALHALSMGKLDMWRSKIDVGRFDGGKLHVYENADSSALPSTTDLQVTDLYKDNHIERHSIQLVESNDSQPEEKLEQRLRFRQELVLSIKEAPEPSDIRWKDLEVSTITRTLKFLVTVFAMIWFICWSGIFISNVERNNPGTMLTPLFITVTNILVPKICEVVNSCESHSTEGARQSSLYIKVAIFRCFNSAIALLIVKGFTGTITLDEENHTDNLNQAIYNLIFAELFMIPIIKLVDVMGIVRKHLLAPRAKDQEEMNSYFVGAKFELAERYTDATKVLFVSLMYSAVLPASLLLGSVALMVHFVVGKFCLLRMWRPTPDVGFALSRLSRNYFFSTTLIVHVIMSSFWWSGYPYDNLCERQDGDGYTYCSQDFLRRGIFPPLPRLQSEGFEWMTTSQEVMTSLYAWTGCIMLAGAAIVFVREYIVSWISSLFYSSYEPDGKDQNIPFTSIIKSSELHGYIPQLREPGFPYPLVACDLSQVDSALVGWKDEFHQDDDFLVHSLYHDARKIVGAAFVETSFSQVRQW